MAKQKKKSSSAKQKITVSGVEVRTTGKGDRKTASLHGRVKCGSTRRHSFTGDFSAGQRLSMFTPKGELADAEYFFSKDVHASGFEYAIELVEKESLQTPIAIFSPLSKLVTSAQKSGVVRGGDS